MAKYNLLIIDDDLENRKRGYETVLGDEYFSIDFVVDASSAERERLKNASPHAYILDMNLSNWDNSGNQSLFRHFTSFIEKKAPVFLISNLWNQDMIKWVNESKDIINIVQYLSWDIDIAAALEKNDMSYVPVRENVKNELDKYYDIEPTLLGACETVNILHISDLQFGDKGYSNDSAFLEALVPRFLKQKGINIHLIAVTGDIAYSGIPSQYKLAEEWFSQFCKEIIGGHFKPRLLLIPGNHDVNFLLNGADKYKYDFTTKKLIEIDSSEKQHHFYGFIAFQEFAFKITDNPVWMTNQNNLCLVNDRFLNWGLRFYHFNSVIDQCHDKPQQCNVPQGNLQKILTPKIPEGVMGIILSHHGPEDFGYSVTGESSAHWTDIRNFIETTGPKLFLHGHSHGFQTYHLAEKGIHNKAMTYHMTSTLSLEKEYRTKDCRRGFSIIEIHRENGYPKPKNAITIRKFEIEGARIREISEE